MKKIWGILLLCSILLLTGCGKATKESVVKDFSKKVESAKGYQLKADLEISNNEDTYRYDVTVSHKEKGFYRVELKNKANNHEQVILKNDDGVYVLTPSLNKSFKFESNWPYNNSQVYLLESLLDDIKNDQSKTYEETKDGFQLITKVNYPNNRSLVKQKITLDKNFILKKVEVMTAEDVPQMTLSVTSMDMKAKFDDDHFALEKSMESASIEEDSIPTGSLEDVIYPLYIPDGTKLTNQEKVAKTNGERIILSFEGEKPFLLVEETISREDELTVIPTYGEPFLLMDTVGSITDNSLTWMAGGIEYYLVSDVMDQLELTEIARSISVIPTMK